ncbi:histidine kinase N-terminal 7TM domain-containing protein [Paenibacillus beijingensis]|uniref:GGDEF domain-containing protein n=1 Tax=Paenibacillus beijingensis TaxID=1126833 RepID=A0A0D5NL32_9BACL|nr:histidine kinase N-terminal 7TM domain-containing protein [Paenibacillus beijingensis]AJY75976.1 hypothetical protein VN24_17220 [Paenibacillus beijingensis]
MNNIISNYVVIVAIAGVFNVLLGVYAYFRTTSFSGMRAFVWTSFTSAVYAFGFAMELASSSLKEIQFWINIEYVGMPFAAPCSLIMTLYYVGLDKFLTRKKMWGLFLIPSATLIMVTTNPLHHLFYRSIYLRQDGPSPLVDIVRGEWYIVHGSYTFGCLFASVCLLVWKWNRTLPAFRKQIVIWLAGHLIPIVGSFLYLMGLSPYGMDPVPVLLSVTSALYIWAILSANMLTVSPVAREYIFESMRDGVLVLDNADRVVDYNAAAVRMLPTLDASVIGKPIGNVWKLQPGFFGAATAGADKSLPDEVEAEWINGDEHLYYEIRFSTLKPKNAAVGTIVVLIDVTEKKRLQERLLYLANYDGLTQIYNRTHFMHESRRLLEQARSSRAPLSFLLLDIDHFKSINDRLGHAAGDQALKHIVSICKKNLRTRDLIGRYGGEEFVLCLPDTTVEQAALIADRIRRDIETSPITTAFGPLAPTASFGAAEAAPHTDIMALESVLSEADRALYSSKRGGRNAVHFITGGTVRKFSRPAVKI